MGIQRGAYHLADAFERIFCHVCRKLETVHRSASAGAVVGNVSAGTSGAVEISISVCLRTAAAFRDTKE